MNQNGRRHRAIARQPTVIPAATARGRTFRNSKKFTQHGPFLHMRAKGATKLIRMGPRKKTTGAKMIIKRILKSVQPTVEPPN